VRHSLVGGTTPVVYRALKVGMPILENGGDAAQLGGEFIFGPGNKCLYAHRMQNTRDHSPVAEVLMAVMNPGPKFKLLPLSVAASVSHTEPSPANSLPRRKPTSPSISQPAIPTSLSHPQGREQAISFSQHPSITSIRFPTYAEYTAQSPSYVDLNADLPSVPVELESSQIVSNDDVRRSFCEPVQETEEEEQDLLPVVPEESEARLAAIAGEATEELEFPVELYVSVSLDDPAQLPEDALNQEERPVPGLDVVNPVRASCYSDVSVGPGLAV